MLSIVGVGGAGSKIAASFYQKDLVSSIFSKLGSKSKDITGVAIDTSESLETLKNLPIENRVLIGKSRAKGHGTGGDISMGRRVMEEECELP